MVDALRRAHWIVRPDGWVIDVHPSTPQASVEVGPDIVGHVTAVEAPARHRAAADALRQAIDARLFEVEDAFEFTFFTGGDSIDELRDYVSENWRDATIDPATVELARTALAKRPGETPRLRERVQITKLRPRSIASPHA